MKDSESRRWFWLAAGLVTLALVWALSTILMPFVVGMAVAYFLDPVADRLERMGASRTLSVVLITVGFFGAAAALLLVLVPPLQAQLMDLAGRVPGAIEALRAELEPTVRQLWGSLSEEQVAKLKGSAGTYAADAVKWLGRMLGKLIGGGMAFVHLASLIVIAPIVSFYLLRDWDHIVAWIDGYLPRDAAPTIREQVRNIDTTLAGFIRGQALVCLVLATYYALALTIIGLDFGLLVGLVAGLISFIPYIGASVGFVVAVGIALFQFDAWLPIAATAAVFLVGQTAEGYVLQPKLVGDRVGLHPVWLIFALLAGGALFGFTGVLLAVPVAATVGVLTRFGLGRYRDSALYKGSGDAA